MEHASLLSSLEQRYGAEVLLLSHGETEEGRSRALINEAHRLGLNISDVDIAASLAASLSFRVTDIPLPLNIPCLSSDHDSISDTTTSTAASTSQLAGYFSDTTISSDRPIKGSLRSSDSLPNRPSSFCSSDGRLAPAANLRSYSSSPSDVSIPRGSKRSSFINVLVKLPFRRRRPVSAMSFPPQAPLTLQLSEKRPKNVPIESITSRDGALELEENQGGRLNVDGLVFDDEAMKRSLEDAELKEMVSQHQVERTRHLALEEDMLICSRCLHETKIADLRRKQKREQTEKQVKNQRLIADTEERQLRTELDQGKEFEREKRNSRIRIKHMEGYCNASGLHSESLPAMTRPDFAADPLPRTITSRQKQQLLQEYLEQDAMDRVHHSKLKVLRERQERKLQEMSVRLEKALEDLVSTHEKSVTQLELEHEREEQELLEAFKAKKKKLRLRWSLEEAILRKKLESKHGLPYGPLPPLSFTHLETSLPKTQRL